MSDEGDKTCPLCAEEMDLTDQQLKPCKCGYEICVWCWHHIMDMAEKDETEGRCPACRNPYNKEKIVGTAAKCESLVSEINVEKKVKSQKGKNKTSEGRKQLSSVRVIQRNLVYIVGLPLNFADEDLLQHRDYFGQYGRVLKVSISRTTTGAIQQFANSTCSVYITYSKEEEAVRCIQFVHGFILDGRPLRACFGTTKYCHAWLRNVPCSNPDCLYLHEIGSQEDSFTKDQIISSYTRDRVQQIVGSSNSMQRRSGNVLPPPEDEDCNNSSAPSVKPAAKAAINTTNTNQNSVTSARVSPPNSSSGRSAALPAGASWGDRTSSNQMPTSTSCFNGQLNQKPEMCNGPEAFRKVTSATEVPSLQSCFGGKKAPNEESTIPQNKSTAETFEQVKKETHKNDKTTTSSDSRVPSVHLGNLPLSKQPHSPPTTRLPPDSCNIVDTTSSGPALDKDSIDATDGNIESVCSDILSLGIRENQQLQNGYDDHTNQAVVSQTSEKAADKTVISTASVQSDSRLGQARHVDLHEMDDDLLSFNNQRIKDPEFASNRTPDFSHEFNLSKHAAIHSPQSNYADGPVSIQLNRHAVDINSSSRVSTSNSLSRHPENMLNGLQHDYATYINSFPIKGKRSLLGKYEGEVGSAAVDMGEGSIISNILSMDFDQWDEPLTPSQNLAKLLGEKDKQQGPFGLPRSLKAQSNSQSRFSFAREDEPISQVSGFGQPLDYYGQAFKNRPLANDFSSSNSMHQERFASRNGLAVFSGMEPDVFPNTHSHISSNKLSVSGPQISAPPGFSVPSRTAPPPGFTSHERVDQIMESLSGNQMLDAASLLRNQYQTVSSGNHFSSSDVEFLDPAILAVGKGTFPGGVNSSGLDTRSSFPPQYSTYEDARFQMFLQRSIPPHQNQRYSDRGDSYSSLGDAYGLPSGFMEQKLSNNLSPYSHFTLPQSRNGMTSNGQWDGWNEAQSGSNLGMADLLRSERLGFNKLYSGFEDSKIRMPSSGNLYNGAYGI